MRVLRVSVFIGVLLPAILGFGQASVSLQNQPPFKPVANIEDIMKSIVDPLAKTVFASVGAIVTTEGVKEFAPKDDKEWDAVRSAAMGVAEAGNLLMFESRAKNRDSDWIEMSQQLIERAVEAANAAQSEDAEKLLSAGGDIFAVCESCHYQYMSYETWIRWRYANGVPCSIEPSEFCR